jgi:hypothetical protein
MVPLVRVPRSCRRDVRAPAPGPSGCHDEGFYDDEHVVRALTKLLDDASSAHRSLDSAEGLQNTR